MENAQGQTQLCQRCKIRPATKLFDWPAELLPAPTDTPAQTLNSDYLLAYQRLCDPCLEEVLHPTVCETVEDIAAALQQREAAKRLIEGK